MNEKELAAYLASLKWIKCVGGVILAPESRPVHGQRAGKVKR